MGDSGCSDIIAVWSFGQEGNCYHEDIGFRVGASGYKQVIFEVNLSVMSNLHRKTLATFFHFFVRKIFYCLSKKHCTINTNNYTFKDAYPLLYILLPPYNTHVHIHTDQETYR